MTHPTWPLFDLRVVTPRLELRYLDDELATGLALLAAKGIHDPEVMPFGAPWTDVASPDMERNAMRYYWRTRAETHPDHWDLPLAVLEGGRLVGTTSLLSDHFPTLRQFETGSWLGREFQGRGIGTEMRQAALHLGFAGLGATLATTAAWHDNHASLGVTRRLGYTPAGTQRRLRRDEMGVSHIFHLTRDDWEARLRRDDITLHGVDPCLPLLAG